MKEQLEQIKAKALADLAAAADMSALDAVRVRVLGKKGELTAVLKQMGKLSPEERPVMGQLANTVRAEIEARLRWRSAAPRWTPQRSSQSSRPRPWMSPFPASPWRWATSTR